MTDVTTLGIAVDSSGVRGATKDMDNMTAASKRTATAAGDFEGAMRRASIQADLIGRAIGSIVNTLIDATKRFIELGHAVGDYQDMALKAGSRDPAGLASLKTAADIADTSVGALVQRMTYLSNVLNRGSSRNSQAEQALKNLNINIEEFKRLGADEQYRKLAEQFEKFADGTRKTANAMALFGRGGADQLVAMHAIAEAGPPIIRYTNEQIAAIDQHTDELKKNRSQLQQWVQAVSVETIPAQVALYKAIKDVVEQWGKLGDTLSEDVKSGIINFSFDVAESFIRAAKEMADFVAETKRELLGLKVLWLDYKLLVNAPFGLVSKQIDAELEILARRKLQAEDELEKLSGRSGSVFDKVLADIQAARARALVGGSRTYTEGEGGPFDFLFKEQMRSPGDDEDRRRKTRATDPIGAAFDEVLGDLAKLQEQLDPTGAKLRTFLELKPDTEVWQAYVGMLDEVKRVTDELAAKKMLDRLLDESRALTMTSAQLREYELGKLGVNEATRQQIEYQGLANDARREENKLLDEARSLTESLLTPQERLIKQLEQISKLSPQLSAEAEVRARQRAYADYDKATEPAKKAVNDIDEFTKQAARNIQDSLGNTLESVLAGNFDNIGKMWANMLRNMVAQALAAKLNRALFGDYGSTGDMGGLIGQFLLWAVGAGGGGVVGPSEGGSRQALQKMGSAPVVVHQTINNRIDSSTDTAKIAGMVQAGVEYGNRQMADQLRAQGVI